MKKFFQKVKLDAKFKSAGEGHRLGNESGRTTSTEASTSATPIRQQPMSESQVNAAIAAMERLERSKPTTSKKRIRLPEDEIAPNQAVQGSLVTGVDTMSQQQEYAVDDIKFVSALTGEAIPKSELNEHYRELLLLKLGSEEAASASCLMIYTLNRDREKVDSAVKILIKYINNIIANKDEEKYRRIRKENKVFCDKVAILEGTEEFLNAVGFKLKMLADSEGEELYFVLADNPDADRLKEAKDLLINSKPLPSKLFRDTKVFKPSDHSLKFHLPDSFYNLTVDEVRREQGILSKEVELNQQLRTKAMRERPRSSRKYNYSLIRVRFPDGFLLQGTFGAHERFSAVRAFVSENLNLEWVPFILRTSVGQIVEEDEETILSLSLVPSVLLSLSWLPDIQAQVNEQGGTLSIKSELLKNASTLR